MDARVQRDYGDAFTKQVRSWRGLFILECEGRHGSTRRQSAVRQKKYGSEYEEYDMEERSSIRKGSDKGGWMGGAWDKKQKYAERNR